MAERAAGGVQLGAWRAARAETAPSAKTAQSAMTAPRQVCDTGTAILSIELTTESVSKWRDSNQTPSQCARRASGEASVDIALFH